MGAGVHSKLDQFERDSSLDRRLLLGEIGIELGCVQRVFVTVIRTGLPTGLKAPEFAKSKAFRPRLLRRFPCPTVRRKHR